MYLYRSIEDTVKKAIKEFPSLILTGSRQSGKTTLLKNILPQSYKYVSMEIPEIKELAVQDPRAFLNFYKPPVILDEIQYASNLLPYIKDDIDANRDKKGSYILTGSQNLMLLKQVSESLAGRAAILKLLPFSKRETLKEPVSALPWENGYQYNCPTNYCFSQLWQKILVGDYPEISLSPDRDFSLWHSSYVQTYLERDLRNLKQIGDLTTFQSFLRTLAARSGQILNLADISRDLGVVLNTCKSWLSILEASFQVIILRPYFSNIGKRLVKSPKVYFTDTGILTYLAGLKEPIHASASPMAGMIFETAVLMELLKTISSRGEEPRIYFWRTSYGSEVDIVLETGDKIIPIEIKISATPRPEMASNLRSFMEVFKDKAEKGYLIHTGDLRFPLSANIEAIPFASL